MPRQPTDPMQREFQMNKDLQREQIDAEMGVNAPYLLQQQRETQAALLEQLDPETIIREMKLTLKGLRFDETTGKVGKESEPLMNNLGIGRIISSVRGIVNQNTIMSAFEEKTIMKIVEEFASDIINDLAINWKEYDIKLKTDLDRIEGICKRMALSALMRSKMGGERRFLGTTTVESINTAPRMLQQKKQNLWSKFKL